MRHQMSRLFSDTLPSPTIPLTLAAGNKARCTLQAVFERLVDIICDKMSESLDNDPGLLNPKGGTRLGEGAQPSNVNCNC